MTVSFKHVLEQMEWFVVEILSVTEEGLGHTSRLIGLGDGTALVVDPARFPEQRQVAADRGWQIAWAADTHSHADYISGSPALTIDGAVFVAPARARLEHPHRGIEPGEDLEIAEGLVLRAISTPGPHARPPRVPPPRARPPGGAVLRSLCGHGERAMTAASILARRGHADLTVLDGGPDDWQRSTGRALESAR